MEDTHTHTTSKKKRSIVYPLIRLNKHHRTTAARATKILSFSIGMWYGVFMFKMVEIDKASYYLPSHQVTFLECVFFFSA